MNNKNKILVGCLALLLVLSVGYALFSETITINGTATAKGSFDIVTTCQTGANSEVLDAWSPYLNAREIINEGGYGESSCTVSGNTVSMNTELKYPTASRAFTISFKNEGSMDAFLYQNGSTPIYNQSLTIYNSDGSVYKSLTSGSSEFNTYLKQFGKFRHDVLPMIKTASGAILTEVDWNSRLYEKTSKTDEYEYYLKLEPGDTLMIVALAFWDEEATMSGYSATTTAITMAKFEQMTSDMKASPDGFTCFTGC